MKFKKFLCSTAFAISATSALAAQNVIEIDDTHPGIVINKQNMMGADLAIWNPPSRYYDMTPALVDGGYTIFRFPNGSLSNDYHWNGAGKYDSTGLWTPSEESWAPGFLGETIYRGTTKDNYGFIRRSHLADNNMETMWWGEILDPKDPPWIVIEFPEKKDLDSIVIDWGNLRPKSFDFSYWTEDYADYPGVHQHAENKLKRWGTVKVTGNQTKYKFPTTRARYVAVKFKTTDLPSKGVQIREMKLYSGSDDLLAGNDYKFFAMSTRNGDKPRTDWTNIKWHFEEFMTYINQLPKLVNGQKAQAVICVNAGTGTSKEAAAWVKYANKVKKYNIKQWQIGNELDGEWEESGPLSARQYAARFIEYARAMKAVDPSIILHGPLFSTHKMLQKGAGLNDGKYWMAEFLRIVGDAEKADGKRYLDVVDLHTYPYWAPENLNAKDMLKASLDVAWNADTLNAWMNRYLEGKRRVFLSEFSTSVQGSQIWMDYPQAAGIANIFAQYAVRFGDRFQALPWDAFGNVFEGPDHTWGTISMTALLKEGSWNRWASLEPTAEYFGVYMAFKRFLENGYAVVPVKSTTADVVPYAICKGNNCNTLLINLTDSKQVVQINRKSDKKKTNGVRTEIDVFGEDQFKWIGDQRNAYPYPKMGPSGRRLEGKNTDIEIPPFGTVVVRMNPPAQANNAPEVLAIALEKKVMTAGDTLDLFVTAVQDGGELAGADIQIDKWEKKPLTIHATPDDGKWNSSIESFHVKIPVTDKVIKEAQELKITLIGKNKKKATFKVPFRVRGAYRTTSVMQNFDNGLDNVSWFPVVNGDNATSMDAKIINGNPPLGGYIRHDFIVEQPPELGWPNYSGAYYAIPEEVKKSVGIVFDYATTHNNPQGYIELQIMSSQVEDYDEFMIRLKNTHGNWTRDTLIWENMQQEGWGKTIPQLDPTKIKNFAFRARHSGKGFISLDNIYLLGEDGKEVPMPRGLRRLR
ncbi:glycoside hydrolase family 44 protein [Fibrobacter sp. UWB11]|uniref:glycoside hydrolase family 44 protein n=1 Tax=Fibrobacter sp. UWB11 TaxID=1896202 RepID=UPI000925A867|nr:glycoside hydrolase family 44 protein [Fibrobacter sp. UWB11]SIN82646.1 Carbohydrate binding domain (family 11) [Fibrobacter sp. UWB11]